MSLTPRRPAPQRHRSASRGRLAAVAVAALTAALVQPLAARAAAPPAPPSDAALLLPQSAGSAAALDLTTSEAVWIDRNTLAWNGDERAASTRLLYSRKGTIKAGNATLTSDDERWLRLGKSTLTDAQKAAFPHLKDYTAWSVDPRDRDRVREALRGQLVASQRAADGAVLAATGVQIAGVLDDVYGTAATKADLGPTFRDNGRPTLAVWAPTGSRRCRSCGARGTHCTPCRPRARTDATVKSASYEPDSGTCAVPGRTVAVFSRTS